MEKINGGVKLHAQIIAFLIIWVAILSASKAISPFDWWAAIREIPEAISIYAIMGIVFVKWVWRWPALQGWLVKIPDLQGTWQGKLQSDYIDPKTKKTISPIPATLVVRQDFSRIDCVLMTEESESYTVSADFNLSPGKELYLAYSYTNRPKTTIRNKSPIHDGAALLKVIQNPNLALEGEYWTNRKTKGEMNFRFASRRLAEKFGSA
jgi:hypothetical protein